MGNQLQHHVPRFMLRGFGKGKKEHMHALDKQSGHRFSFAVSRKALGSVAAEYGMYGMCCPQPVSRRLNRSRVISVAFGVAPLRR